jgi:OmpA-OmpF porin, OOP family
VSDTLLARLSSTISRSTLEDLASHMGESDQAVSRGMELSTAAVLGGLLRKAGDSDTMRQVIDLAAKTPVNAVMSGVSGGQLTDSNSTVIAGTTHFLSSLFGGSQGAILDWIARESGLRAGAARTLLALGAQSVLSFIGTRVRDEGMTAGALSALLQSEAPNLRRALPAEFNEAFTTPSAGVRTSGPVTSQTIGIDPVIAEAVREQRSILPWLLPVAVILIGAFWLANRPGPTVTEAPVARAPIVGTSGRSVPMAPADAALGTMMPRRLSDGTTIIIPQRGVESRLLAFINDSNSSAGASTWFDFDRLLFATGSATLEPQSQEQLRDIAAILRASPNVHLKIGGYTDNVGSVDQNIRLSQDRANNVRAELVQFGVASDRLVAKGYGEAHPIGDNSTDAGRAMNRRISMLVTQR